jgi:uncharacterized protein (DUF1800 family)
MQQLAGALLALGVLTTAQAQQPGGLIFRHGMENAHTARNDADARAFLTRATFGALDADVALVRQLGFQGWIDAQMALPPTLHRPTLDARDLAGVSVSQNDRQVVWFDRVINAPDQLRQRVAFALSEILVVSDRNGTLEGNAIALAHYYDMLLQGAFGNFRQLLGDVTLSPVMGIYLSMFRSTKDEQAGIEPDENYAREIMQLFSIGLVQLNQDGTPMLDNENQPIPTYDIADIVGLAHVFTGWNYAGVDADGMGGCQDWEWDYPDQNLIAPMEYCQEYHVTEPQTIVGGAVISATDARQALDDALDVLFNHPNVGPFLATRLIQRLVTSNPSPDYVSRVAGVFNDNGLGVRGDLGATVRAILTDHEAVDGYWMDPVRFGKLREPLLQAVQLWRILGLVDSPEIIADPDCCWRDAIYRPQNYFGQAALRSPSVFNFFRPDYAPPGAIQNAGMVSPEFQIATETNIMAGTNFFFSTLVSQYPPSFPWQTYQRVDIDALMPLSNDPDSLVAWLNDRLMSGQMSDVMRSTISVRLAQIVNADTLGQQTQRVVEALYYVMSAPEYKVQK